MLAFFVIFCIISLFKIVQCEAYERNKENWLFFGIQWEGRFTAKIVLDLIFGCLSAGFGAVLVQLPLLILGTIDRNINAAIFMFVMIVCILALYRLHRDLNQVFQR